MNGKRTRSSSVNILGIPKILTEPIINCEGCWKIWEHRMVKKITKKVKNQEFLTNTHEPISYSLKDEI